MFQYDNMTTAEIRKQVKTLFASDVGFPGCLGSTRGLSLSKPGKRGKKALVTPIKPDMADAPAVKSKDPRSKLLAHLLGLYSSGKDSGLPEKAPRTRRINSTAR